MAVEIVLIPLAPSRDSFHKSYEVYKKGANHIFWEGLVSLGTIWLTRRDWNIPEFENLLLLLLLIYNFNCFISQISRTKKLFLLPRKELSTN